MGRRYCTEVLTACVLNIAMSHPVRTYKGSQVGQGRVSISLAVLDDWETGSRPGDDSEAVRVGVIAARDY